ncbi:MULTISPECIES: IS3 family transposase [Rhizobium/Agrobacterium group]|uniref:IS3 family transposase n=2 Tax=Rhizobiaceae TaxID=82115 RepID=UPI000B3FE717|nr:MULTISPECIES: IS3 family transposase [Rhizobium/Agrobacterium group]MCF1450859.1 IS3 family transposase [Allorhizobium ampelinum]MCF1496515.1 IS3 family transposase [Allorhizobium ampelinum]MVA49122.1 IS3 family transposase [Agrobacterium vitis]NSZ43162.1 IS3 family transposase [Agrobacterium vitis]NTA26819.1 IS3 family transposase [Allorhizobium ampelinum]
MQRRIFSREYKLEAVKLVRERGVTIAQAARDLDVHENVLRKWIREYRDDPSQSFPGKGQMKPEQLEIERLRREVAKLKAERDIPKKGRSLLCQGRDMRFAFIAKHRSIWPVAWLCEALGVSRSGFHAWLNRSPSEHARYDEVLLDKITQSFKSSDRTYGARRVWHDVLEEGLSCGLHRIERLMRLNALRARPRRRGLPKDAGDRAVIMPNVLDRQFMAERPNQKWVADFTYIWTAEGWLYVAAVIDLFSRRVVGWSMNANMTAQLVTDALIMAIWRRGKPDALLHHSDQGSQYTSEQFQHLMGDYGITCSMSRSGNVWDNAAMESFFSSLKTERTARKVYRTRNDARADVFDYIERFYNPKRRHSTLGYLSPNDFETKVGLA